MKNFTFCILIFFNLNAVCQPILNASDVTAFNVTGDYYFANSSIIGVGASGANVTWNFSSLEPTFAESRTFKTVSTAPNTNSFPTSNNIVSISDQAYKYNTLTSTKIEQNGDSVGPIVSPNYVNPQTIYTFPFTFNTTFSDTSQMLSSSPIETSTRTYDAYGTVITPYGTFTDCFRVKISTTESPEVRYEWYKLNPYRQIIIAQNFGTTNTNFEIFRTTNLNSSIFETSNVTIFPNPVSSVLNVAMANNVPFNQITIHDSVGKIIYKDSKSNASVAINTENFRSGLYFVSVVTDGLQSTTKFIKN